VWDFGVSLKPDCGAGELVKPEGVRLQTLHRRTTHACELANWRSAIVRRLSKPRRSLEAGAAELVTGARLLGLLY
jgi:hypothetical protein